MTSAPSNSGLPSHVDMFVFSTGALDTNCYVLIDRSQDHAGKPAPATVIDPGHGAFDAMTRAAQERDFAVEKIVLTHGHIDHMRDAARFEVPVFVHAADRGMVVDPSILPVGLDQIFAVDQMSPIGDLRDLPMTEATSGPGKGLPHVDIAGISFEIHHMPGHSPGSVMYRIPGLIVGGDVLFRGGVGRTDLPLSNPQDMMTSLSRITQLFDHQDTVLPGHGPQTTIGHEEASNPFLHAVN